VATRSVELQLKLTNAKSISDLESVLKEINADLKQIDVNSEAFTELSNTAKKADGQLKNIKDDLRGISNEKQLDSVAKLGGSIAAAMSVATIAVTAFGSKTNEEIQKAIQVATSLGAVISAIKPITEGLTSSNRRAFTELIKGFQQSAIGAKLFGTTTRAALTATGIGLFVIALGTIVAYWDDIAKAIGLASEKEKEFFEISRENIDKVKDSLTQYNTELASQNELLSVIGYKESEIFQNRRAGLNAQLVNQKALRDELQRELNLLLSAYNVQKQQFDISNLTKEQYFEISKILEKNGGSINDNVTRLKKEFDEASKGVVNLSNQLSVLSAQEDKFNEEQRKKAFFDQVERYKATAKRVEDEQSIEKEAQDEMLAYSLKLSNEYFEKQKQLKVEEVNFDIEQEQEKVDNVDLSEQELFRIRFQASKRQEIEQKKNYENNLNAAISYYKSLSTLTEEQEQALSDLQSKKFDLFIEKLNNVLPIVQQVQSSFNDITGAITDILSRQIDSIDTQLETIDNQYTQSIENRKALEAQLADAQGAARDELLAGIDEERTNTQRLYEQQRKLENQKIKAQNKQNEINWLNSLVNATTNTALGVTQALSSAPPPYSFILAALVAAAGGIEIGVISSNKPSQIPGYAEGGFTTPIGPADNTGYRVAGVVHEGEYVVPQHILRSNAGSELVRTLEAMRQGMPTFADGGFTSSIPVSIDTSSVNSLSTASLTQAFSNIKIYASWTEARDVSNTVDFIESRSSL
jgi:hypothetical protein